MLMSKFRILALCLGCYLSINAGIYAGDKSVWEQLKLPDAVQGRAVHSVFFLDAKQGWVVGDKGLCLVT